MYDNIKIILAILGVTALAVGILVTMFNFEVSGQDNGSQQQHSIRICCAWGDKLADGSITYHISSGAETHAAAEQAVRNAIDEWNSKINGVKLVEMTNDDDNNNNAAADVEIKFDSKPPKIRFGQINDGNTSSSLGVKKIRLAATEGISKIIRDNNGFITNVLVTISTADPSGRELSIFDPDRIEAIAKHEIGHVLGIGHANFTSDLMSPILTYRTDNNISKCDTNAVLQANSWKLVDLNGTPNAPTIDHVNC